jgi:hypothetical protein
MKDWKKKGGNRYTVRTKDSKTKKKLQDKWRN